ncbi:multidrug resistance protein [Apiospora marii]|uniref:multidrug resistance protein n=1 Tax=Apiospora marii TaxID=335849 RepID=UPI00312DA58C
MDSPNHQATETVIAVAKEKPAGDMLSGSPQNATYTILSEIARRAIVWTASFAAMFSGLSSFIYYPVLQPLATDLRVSLQLVNLTITSYLVVAGLAPSLIGDMADHTGRRPVYVVVLTFYFGANIGLALQRSYVALLLLRMLQSAGSSAWIAIMFAWGDRMIRLTCWYRICQGTISLAYGVISDITQAKDRGSYVGVLMVLGGVLAEKAGWRWIFWLLTILSGILLLCITLFFPETCRRIVGNGSVPATGYNRTVISILKPCLIKDASQDIERQTGSIANETSCEQRERSRKCHIPNPLSILKILLDKGSFSTMFAGSMAYTIFGCLGASLSAHCIQIYKLNYLQAGLIYLPRRGRLLDYNYKLTARTHDLDADRGKEDSLHDFPIEEARLRSVWYLMALSIMATIGYGWALDRKSHLAVPLVMQFVTGSTMVGMFTVSHPSSNTAQEMSLTDALGNSDLQYAFVRPQSWIHFDLASSIQPGAAGIAAQEAMVDGVGLGWCFTIMGLILACTVPLLVLLQAKGHQWRRLKANG